MLPELHARVLRRIATRLATETVVWAVTGSAGFALQGVPVAVHDLDLQADRHGAYVIERCFADCVVQSVRFSAAERIRSHFGVLAIDGLRVELMGDICKRRADGSWEHPVPLTLYRHFVILGNLRIPVLDLAYEARAYRQLGRMDKADLLDAFLAHDPRA